MLGKYKFKVVYTSRKENSKVDTLSYRLDIEGTTEIINTAILKVNSNRLLGLAFKINTLLTVRNNVLKKSQKVIT
jgi:hypothetical protein